ncbi:MAG: DUF998 domain-containing protein [Ktedonobacteraceae bacterium]|nr:DUF998 domain-containing protein [Ktedonobacteraceae bacterium]
MLTKKNQTVGQPLTTRLLLACGVVSPFLFTTVLLIEGATRPGYNSWVQTGSALSLGEQGWMQITNFIVNGLLLLCFAIGVRQTLRTGKGATWGPILLAVVGGGLIVAGIFVTDPSLGYPPGTPPGSAFLTTVHGAIHFFVGAFSFFGGLPAACFVLARRWASDAQWKGWTTYSLATGVLMVAFFVAFVIVGMLNGPAGLVERITICIGLAWIVFLAIGLLSKNTSSDEERGIVSHNV